MKKYMLLLFVFAWILLCVGNYTTDFCELQNNHSNTELVFEHHNENDQIYIVEGIVFRTTSFFIEITMPLLVKREYHNPIWKPPINS